ncbi:MAG: hypothetical protein CVU19_13610 [Betaproteobacteria bacterium HGW-Betaproteobacteria-13]|uniref:Uncharacterized protein n=1 Tax=Parazoarcus communis TaxID=41977 RepID=A0A2U8H7H7_9RHOO|nr:hypothetical protein [Parazoarcus communis]AWI81633.1 hypothetical protein CEW87_21095 [Parazoarcus communis]PKL94802.1 MAG: hypothetical protein CVV18_07780 [Gammaproteobacteria bacterium HGW-Gammaproteobacteria-8]PKO80207.1 MAG: hypothetical protein CVU19_13610 [Betaproteobacteria bacterium HGW-Betaproteobacteria-13]
MQNPSTHGGPPPHTRLLLRLSAAAFAIFWAAIISGKLRTSFGYDQFPLVPEMLLALILALGLAIGLGACLLEEQRRAINAPALDTTTEGDTK